MVTPTAGIIFFTVDYSTAVVVVLLLAANEAIYSYRAAFYWMFQAASHVFISIFEGARVAANNAADAVGNAANNAADAVRGFIARAAAAPRVAAGGRQ